VNEQVFMDFHRRFPTEQSVDEQRKRMPLQLILGDGTIYERIGSISFVDREVNAATGRSASPVSFPIRTTCCDPADTDGCASPNGRRSAQC